MDYFKVFADSPSSSSSSDPQATQPISPDSETDSPVKSNPWAFGSTLFRTIASKSESLIDNYYKDFQEFSFGLKEETSVIRQVASRAVHDLPARLESGAAIAQESLEAVGQAIDNVGSAVTEIVGKELNFGPNDKFFNAHLDKSDEERRNKVNFDKNPGFSEDAKPYSRINAIIRTMQGDFKTYCDEVEESGYSEWKLGFSIGEKKDEIEGLFEDNGAIKQIHDEVVPLKVDEQTFWSRYFYRVHKVIKAEEMRMRIMKRAIAGEEEEDWGWDVDSDIDASEKNEIEEKMENVQVQDEKGLKRVDNPDKPGASGTKTDGCVDEKKELEEKASSEGTNESDFSIIMNRASLHEEEEEEEEDLGWDEIEYTGSGDDSKGTGHREDLRKRLSASEEEEDLKWDIGDDDDVPVKP